MIFLYMVDQLGFFFFGVIVVDMFEIRPICLKSLESGPMMNIKGIFTSLCVFGDIRKDKVQNEEIWRAINVLRRKSELIQV